jgi:hypothetical protein
LGRQVESLEQGVLVSIGQSNSLLHLNPEVVYVARIHIGSGVRIKPDIAQGMGEERKGGVLSCLGWCKQLAAGQQYDESKSQVEGNRLTAGANLRRAVVGSLNCQVAVGLLLA